MSTIDTSSWNPNPDLNESLEGIPLTADASVAMTWQAIRILMAGASGDRLALEALIVPFTGATASTDGAEGFVPAPEAGEQDKLLRGDGTWAPLSDLPVVASGTSVKRTLSDRLTDIINVKDFGAKGDGSTDDTTAIQAALDAGLVTGKTVVFPAGTYAFTEASVTADETHRAITLEAVGHVVLHSTKTQENRETDENDSSITGWHADFALGFFGRRRGNGARLSAGISAKSQKLGAVFSNVKVGDLVLVKSTQLVGGENRNCWTVGQTGKVCRLTTSEIFLYDSLEYAYPEYSTTPLTASVVENVVDGTVERTTYFESLSVSDPRDAMYKIVCTGGANNGLYAYVTVFDPDTHEVHFGEEEPGQTQFFTNAVADEDTFSLIKETTIESIIPITVKILGDFTVSRDFVTSTIHESEGFRAISVRYGDECLIDGIKIKNFDATGIEFWHSYKSMVVNAEITGCNDDNTGYGFLDLGSYGCRCTHSNFTACRAATSTDGGENRCQSVDGEVDHCTCYGSGVPDNSYGTEGDPYTPEEIAAGENIFYPVGTTSNQGFSTHGDALNHVIDSCQCYGTYSAHRVRGENETVMNCSCVGRQGIMFNIKGASGVRIVNNRLDSLPSLMGRRTAFATLAVDENYSWKKTLYILDNTAINVTGQFLTVAHIKVNNPIVNLVVCRNSVSFGERQDTPVIINPGTKNEQIQSVLRIGVGATYNTNTRARMRGCRFMDNIVLNPDADDVAGFIKPYISFYLEENQYVNIERGVYVTRLTADGTVAIPVHGVNSVVSSPAITLKSHAPLLLTVIRQNNFKSPACSNVFLQDVANAADGESMPDTSPLLFNNKRGGYIQETSSDPARSGCVNFKLYRGTLYITNSTTSSVSLFVKIDGVF